jgi:ABC-2 type transport system permease protein
MSKTSLIIRREYLTRIRKKSFIIMSILGPFIFAAYVLVPMYFATMEDKEEKTVVVIDRSGLFTEYGPEGPYCVLPETRYLKFRIIEGVPLESYQTGFDETGYYAVLFIPENILASESAILYSTRQISIDVTNHIRTAMDQEVEHLKLASHDIHDIEEILKEVQTSINVRNIKWTKEGKAEESNTGVVMGVGYLGGLLIFFFIFFFGSQVMRGVIEEKTSRIIEVIVSSVRPFQLMMGKIVGVGLTGLTQFVIWIVFSLVLISGIRAAFFPELSQTPTEKVVSSELFHRGTPGAGAEAETGGNQAAVKPAAGTVEEEGMAEGATAEGVTAEGATVEGATAEGVTAEGATAEEMAPAGETGVTGQTDVAGETGVAGVSGTAEETGIAGETGIAEEIFASLQAIDPLVMLLSFLFYFLFGYLLYAAMFAVIGSAVDNETDTQQLMWPVILPLILAIYVMVGAINNPDGSLPFWFSIIPFTSPVVMMVRIPFGVPWWQVALSGSLLVATFLGMTWVAGKVYRTGILMYGKKISYREIWKWLRYSS